MFKNIHHEFAPIIICLENQIMAGEQNRSGQEAPDNKIREKTDDARTLKWKIWMLTFY